MESSVTIRLASLLCVSLMLAAGCGRYGSDESLKSSGAVSGRHPIINRDRPVSVVIAYGNWLDDYFVITAKSDGPGSCILLHPGEMSLQPRGCVPNELQKRLISLTMALEHSALPRYATVPNLKDGIQMVVKLEQGETESCFYFDNIFPGEAGNLLVLAEKAFGKAVPCDSSAEVMYNYDYLLQTINFTASQAFRAREEKVLDTNGT